MFCNRSLMIVGLALTLLCGTSVAMDHSPAGPSAGALAKVPCSSSECVLAPIKVTDVDGSSVVLDPYELRRLNSPFFCNYRFVSDAVANGIKFPFALEASDLELFRGFPFDTVQETTLEIFKAILNAPTQECIQVLLQKKSVKTLILLTWLFDFFCSAFDQSAIARILVQKCIQEDIVHLLPASFMQQLHGLLPAEIHATHLFEKKLPYHSEAIECMAISPQGQRLVTGDMDGKMRVWNLATRQCEGEINSRDLCWQMAITPDGKRLVTTDQRSVQVWNLITRNLITSNEPFYHDLIAWFAITPDGTKAIIGSEAKRMIAEMNLATGEYKLPEKLNVIGLIIFLAQILCGTMTSDGKYVIVGGHNCKLHMRDLVTGAVSILDSDGTVVFSLAITPDDKYVVTGSDKGIVSVFDLTTRSCLARLPGHSDRVLSVAIAPDGASAFTSSKDGTVRIWDLRTLQCSAVLTEQYCSINSVIITPDGKQAILGSQDGTVRMLDLSVLQLSTEQLVFLTKIGQGRLTKSLMNNQRLSELNASLPEEIRTTLASLGPLHLRHADHGQCSVM